MLFYIEELTPPAPISGDIVLWRHNLDDYIPTFSATKTSDHLHIKSDRVVWHILVWFSQAIPHHYLCYLLVILWERYETRDHLFFACPYYFTVIKKNTVHQ